MAQTRTRLEDYESEVYTCCKCSLCKFIAQPAFKSKQFSAGCPSIEDGSFHVYSGGGKMGLSNGILAGMVDYSEEMLDAIYRCTLCGSCEIQCRQTMGNGISINEVLHALRIRCVEDGQLLPAHMMLIDCMKAEDNPFGEPKAERGKWAEGLNLKDATTEKVEVLFHAGCRFSYDQDLREVVRGYAQTLKDAGVDFGIAGKGEACCGGRAFDIGYRAEMEKYSEDMESRVKASGAKILVTPCSDCFGAFKYYYPWIESKMDVEVLHITQYLDRLISEGTIKIQKEVPMKVTYHDPCHLGRLGEPYEPWTGQWKKVLGQLHVTDSPKPLRTGEKGVYDSPRNILKNIPGLKFVEMERIRQNSWCCGAGAGALEAFEGFAQRTAMKRIEEAKSTGAEALVTSCPWCERNFKDALKEAGEDFKIYDIMELLK